MAESGLLNKVRSFFVVSGKTKSQQTYRVGLLAGLLTAFLAFLLLAAGVFRGYDLDLHALIMQIGHRNPTTYGQMLIVKKDQATSELIDKNPDRAEFASLFSLLGASQIVETPPVAHPPAFQLLRLELGFYKDIKELPIKTSFNDWSGFVDSSAPDKSGAVSLLDQSGLHSMSRQVRDYFKENPEKSGFTSFIKINEQIWPPMGQNALKALAGGKDYLLLPTTCLNWSDPRLAEIIRTLGDVATIDWSQLEKTAAAFSSHLKLLERWGRLFACLARSNISFELDVCPRSDTFLRINMRLEVAPPPPEYIVDPAAIIGFDFVLQGEKIEMPEADQALETAIASSASRIVLAGHTKIEQDFSAKHQEIRAGDIATSLDAKTEWVTRQIMPHPRFVKGNAEVAFIDISMGSKSYVTEVPLFVISESDKKLLPAFSLKIAMHALDKKFPDRPVSYTAAMYQEFARIYNDVVARKFLGPLVINDLAIPVNSFGRMLIDYVGSAGRGTLGNQNVAIPSVSLYECLSGDTLKQFLTKMPQKTALQPEKAHNRVLSPVKALNKGHKIVLVGPFEVSDFDFFPTPLDFDTPFRVFKDPLMGIEIHANAIINILEQRYIKHPHGWHTMVALLLSCLLLGFLLDIFSPGVGALLTLAFMGGAFWQSYESYHTARQMFNIAALLFSYPLIWTLATLTNYIRQRVQAKATKDMFSRFVAADVVQYMLDNPELVRPGGEKVELTIFFSDVAGFTSISEALTPEELVVLLNEYLGAMTDLLFEYGGTLDKFIGDAVMAFWNFPRKQEDHAVRACLCAIAMQRKINELQIGWAERGLPRVSARAGVNTANVVVGYMGSQKAQMNFTCMGDGVNLASRLEGANKEYGTALMVSDATFQKVKHVVTGRFLDFLAVKGKKEPVKVFELVSEIGKEPPEWSELAALYDAAIQLHLDRQWDEAIATFEKILARWPKDGPSATYIARCQEYKLNPPPEKWDGRYILTHK